MFFGRKIMKTFFVFSLQSNFSEKQVCYIFFGILFLNFLIFGIKIMKTFLFALSANFFKIYTILMNKFEDIFFALHPYFEEKEVSNRYFQKIYFFDSSNDSI